MKKIALGQACPATGMVQTAGKMNDEERILALEQQVDYLMLLINALRSRLKRESLNIHKEEGGVELDAPHGLNKDGLPIGYVCIGET